MSALLTLSEFIENDLPNIGYNSNDTHLYRIYLSAGRFGKVYIPIVERNNHPDWWTAATGHKSFIDKSLVLEYKWTRNPDVLTPFLCVLAYIFNIKEEEFERVTEEFYGAVSRVVAEEISFEQVARGHHVELH